MYINIAVDKIKPDPNQPRRSLNSKQQERIKGIAQSMKSEGVINAIEVDEHNQIITGEIRWRAAKLAGLKEIPCKVVPNLSLGERFRRQVVENIHHNTMGDLDTAKALSRLLKEDNGDMEKLSEELGISVDYIKERLSILNASADIKHALKKQDVSYTHVRELLRLEEKYRSLLEKKILAGEFKKSNSVSEIVSAINRNPEKIKELLSINYSKYPTTAEVIEIISKISPRLQEVVEGRLEPGRQFVRLKGELVSWLKDNDPESIPVKDRPIIILGMMVLANRLTRWGREASELKKSNNLTLKG